MSDRFVLSFAYNVYIYIYTHESVSSRLLVRYTSEDQTLHEKYTYDTEYIYTVPSET